MNPSLAVGQFKQEVLKLYNEINQEIFNTGVRRQRVDVVGDKVLIFSIHRRASVSKTVDGMDRELTRLIDALLIDRFKLHIKQKFEQQFHMKVTVVLKDYDVETKYSGTIVILDREVADYLTD